MRNRLKGSYTVEAAWVMAVVLLAILTSVSAAYQLRDETAATMALHGAAERLRHGEKETANEAGEYAGRLAGKAFSRDKYEFKIEETKGVLTGRKVKASGKGGAWSLEINRKEYDPENFLRLCSLLHREE